MPDMHTDTDTLEEVLRRHDVSMRHLNPWWVKLYRRLGLRPKPPVLFSLAEHYQWEGISILGITSVGYLLSWWAYGTPPSVLPVFLALAIVLPLINWLIRRRIRARIGQ